MEITFEIDIPEDESVLLQSILRTNDDGLNQAFNKIALTSLFEYKKMILGQKVFTRGRDIIEYRLFLFIKYLWGNVIPEEQKICDLFQVTTTESRSLIKSVMSKYQYEMREAIHDSLREQVRNVQLIETGEYTLTINNQFFKDELNRILGRIDATLPIIEKNRGTIASYIIKVSSYNRLCNYFGLIPIEHE